MLRKVFIVAGSRQAPQIGAQNRTLDGGSLTAALQIAAVRPSEARRSATKAFRVRRTFLIWGSRLRVGPYASVSQRQTLDATLRSVGIPAPSAGLNEQSSGG